MWNKIKAMFRKWLGKKLPEITPPILKPDEKSTTPSTGIDAIPFADILHTGGNHSFVGRQALPVKILRSARIIGDKIHLDYDTIADWPKMGHSEPDGSSWQSFGRLCCAMMFDDGTWRGSHFDWLSGDQKVKLTENIYNGYLFQPPPPEDARFVMWLLSNDGAKRSNIVGVIQ